MAESLADDKTSEVCNPVPVVAIGASAGGVRALQELFRLLPDDSGAAYVVIVHLDPEYGSELARILSSCTGMPVAQVTEQVKIEANKVYVIPPNRQLIATLDEISTRPFEEPRGRRAPIDYFFRSYAEHHGDGFAIVLTGAGSDGSLGVKDVKENGGLILVQDPNEAEYPSMPRNAIASGSADLVLPIRALAARLPELIVKKQRIRAEKIIGDDEDVLRRIFGLLRLRTGHDFSNYKKPTVARRLARRMQVVRTETLQEYADLLRDNAEEVKALFDDLLISVTRFFRDPEAFRALAALTIPKLLERSSREGRCLRIWVPGCATGEEVYTIAMLVLEESARTEVRPDVQIFASDLDEGALAAAREGAYPSTIGEDVSDERLQRFFTHEGDHYCIKRELRDLVVFATHSLLRDPPFSQLDLISCRNLLIYLDRDLQHQIAATFHYALRPGGALFVGSSENVETGSLFRLIDRDASLFEAIDQPRDRLPPLPRLARGSHVAELLPAPPARSKLPIQDMGAHRRALEELAPPSILIDEHHLILTLSENAGRFLLHPGGPITSEAPDIVRPELRLDLRAALHRVFEQGKPTLSIPVAVHFDGELRHVAMQVRPVIRDSNTRAALVVFVEGGIVDRINDESLDVTEAAPAIVSQLKEELFAMRDHLRASRDQYEAVTEELSASNEELQSMNEEYRSTSEELETSKEELQSINEELQTLNNELKLKLDSVSRAHNDLQNLMAATDVATLFLDPTMRIDRFTPRVSRIFNVVAGDEGRPIADFTHKLEDGSFLNDARSVLMSLTTVERTIASKDDRFYLMRVRPYRTLDDRIEGVVITFVDVTQQRLAEAKWEAGQRLLLGELSHRIKNTHAVIQAISRRSLRDSGATQAAQDALHARLGALAKSHDLLLRTDWKPVDLATIAHEQLAGHTSSGANQINVGGPQIQLSPELVSPVGLLIHELATNAAKYGALSGAEGVVDLKWATHGDERDRKLEISWRERGGPVVREPEKRGFGAYLMEKALSDAVIKRDFKKEGFACSIILPLPAEHSPATADQAEG